MERTKKNHKRSLFNGPNKVENKDKTKMSVFSSSKKPVMTDTGRIQSFSKVKKREETKMELKYDNSEEKKINLITINLNDVKNNVYIPPETLLILDIYNYEEAKINDKRSFFKIFQTFLAAKEIFMYAILYDSQIERWPIRLSLLKFLISSDIALNAIFYLDDKITDYYYSDKNIALIPFTNNIVILIIVLLIGYILKVCFLHLINSSKEIRNIFRVEEEKIKQDPKYEVPLENKKEIIIKIKSIIKKFRIKVIIFYIIEFVIMLFYWYYVTIFCYIYRKTIKSWLIDCVITIILRFIIDILLSSLFAFLYIRSLGCNCKCLFNATVFLYCFA